MKNYNYHYITEYLPVRYNANQSQQNARELCYRFKSGNIDLQTQNLFLEKIKQISNGKDCLVCFIPASTTYKTDKRYNELADFLNQHNVRTAKDAIFNTSDREAEHLTGKTDNPIENFGFNSSSIQGERIILIDDIITRGRTFNMTAEMLERLGAKEVEGLFLAKTINPDWNGGRIDAEAWEDEDPEEEEWERQTYEEYNGTYVQDIEGWSDQDIDDVLDGEPDAYWNID